jgi:hypothetical protein
MVELYTSKWETVFFFFLKGGTTYPYPTGAGAIIRKFSIGIRKCPVPDFY